MARWAKNDIVSLLKLTYLRDTQEERHHINGYICQEFWEVVPSTDTSWNY